MWQASRGTHEQERRRAQSIAAIRGGWRSLLFGVTVLAGSGLAVLFLPTSPLFKGVVAGVLFASAFWAPFTAVTITTYAATVGSWGEAFTRELLKQEKPSWPTVDDVPMLRRNVDHVAMSPRAVLAIETKYVGASAPWVENRLRDQFLAQAQDSARSVRLLLSSADIRQSLPVEAVLMVWGPGAPKQEAWHRDGGVFVVAGRHGAQFLAEWDDGEITTEQAKIVKAGLEAHRARRRRYERDRQREGPRV